MEDPAPTFSNGWDRVTFLLAEYKFPLTVMILAAGVWAAYATPQIPQPPEWTVNFSVAGFLMALPTWIVGAKISAYLYPEPDYVKVGVANPGEHGDNDRTGEYRVKKVLPDVWAGRTESKNSALRPKEGVDFVVTAFNWMEDIGELEVRGCEQADLPPADAWTNANRVETVYREYSSVKRMYSSLKGRVNDLATDVHDITIMEQIAEKEKAELSPGVSITDEIEGLEREVEDLPEGAGNDGLTPEQRSRGVDGVLESVDDAFDELRADAGGPEIPHPDRPIRNDGGETHE